MNHAIGIAISLFLVLPAMAEEPGTPDEPTTKVESPPSYDEKLFEPEYHEKYAVMAVESHFAPKDSKYDIEFVGAKEILLWLNSSPSLQSIYLPEKMADLRATIDRTDAKAILFRGIVTEKGNCQESIDVYYIIIPPNTSESFGNGCSLLLSPTCTTALDHTRDSENP